jgi:hypothetical protein
LTGATGIQGATGETGATGATGVFSGTLTANIDANGFSILNANVIDANVISNVDYIDFNTAYTANTFVTGRTYWDNTKGTLAVDMGYLGNITQQIGEDQYIYVKANTNLTAGRVAQFVGVQGDTILADHANTASVGFVPRYVIGIVPANIATGNFGYVQTIGEVYNLQTNAFTAGSILYLQANTDGNLTATEPTAPNPKIVMAACLVQSSTPSSTNGKLQVRPDFGYYMNQLHNVSNATANTNDVLVYNSSNVWTPTSNVILNGVTANTANVGTLDINTGVANSGIWKFNGNNISTNTVFGNVNSQQVKYSGQTDDSPNGFVYLNNIVQVVDNPDAANNSTSIGTEHYFVNANGANHVFGTVGWSSPAQSNVDSNGYSGQYVLTVYHANSSPTALDGSGNLTQFSVNSAGTFTNVQAPVDATAAFLIQNYGTNTANAAQAVALRVRRRRGYNDARLPVEPNDYLGNIEWQGSRNTSGQFATNRFPKIAPRVDSTYTAGNANIPVGMEFVVCNATANITHFMYANGNVSFASVVFANGNVTSNANVNANNANIGSGNINLYANGYISTNNEIDYLRTYASFYNTNDIAITANTVANIDLPSTYSANGISIVSNNQITVERAGTYDIQVNLQLLNTDNAADREFDVWFAKNGTDIANSATVYTVVKGNGKNVVSVNFIDTCSANDYYQIRYAADSANVSLEAFANISSPYVRPAIPSARVTVVPVGA